MRLSRHVSHAKRQPCQFGCQPDACVSKMNSNAVLLAPGTETLFWYGAELSVCGMDSGFPKSEKGSRFNDVSKGMPRASAVCKLVDHFYSGTRTRSRFSGDLGLDNKGKKDGLCHVTRAIFQDFAREIECLERPSGRSLACAQRGRSKPALKARGRAGTQVAGLTCVP